MGTQAMRVTTLAWGVKQSFRNYVEMSGGTIAAGAGAARTADGELAFEAAADSDLSVDGGALSGAGRFVGEVTFQAHGGMLSVALFDPGVETGPDGAALTVADTAARTRRVVFAKLDLAAATAGPDGSLSIPAAITLDGMFILGDHYPPGTALDPVRLSGA